MYYFNLKIISKSNSVLKILEVKSKFRSFWS